MAHLRNLTKSIENSFRKNQLGDCLIQVYRMLKIDVNIGSSNPKYYAYRGGDISWRVYPVGSLPTHFVEPPEEVRCWK